ncbi:hypothetical protein EDD15DRAFT_2191630 [Pisolithus albus]|nr:hypothetical protein EDD15DRAFT_2191630 [Pisolithus albus]
MPSFSKVRGYSDKENVHATRGPEGPGGRSRRPSEKLKQLTAEQQELAERREVRAQKDRKRLQLRQLAEEGSDSDEREGARDDQCSIDDDNNGGDEDPGFTSRVVTTRLSGTSQERLSYSKNKIPRAPTATIDYDGEIAASNDEDAEEFHSTPHWSSDRQMRGKFYLHSAVPISLTRHRNRVNVAPAMKQRRESSQEDVVEPTMVKAQKLVEHEGRPRTRDYDDVTQEFIMTVIGEYRARLCAEAPMPDHLMETNLLDASWVQACKVTGRNMARSPQLAKIVCKYAGLIYWFNLHAPWVTNRGSQVRGQLKTKLRPLVEAIFGFLSSQSKSAIKKNRSLAESLKEGTNFAFKHMSADDDGRRGFLKAPLIQKIINTMWFANKHDDGVRFHNHFKPFPYPALALVLTAIECCIDEWMTGTRTDIPFSIQEYRGVYESHLKCLQAFEEATRTYAVLPAICMRLYEAGWYAYITLCITPSIRAQLRSRRQRR